MTGGPVYDEKEIFANTKLSATEELFCQLFVQTGNIKEAYRQATGRVRSTQLKVGPYRWMNDPRIQERIKAIYQAVRDKTEFTLQTHLSTLEQLRDEARGAGKFSAAIVAEVARGRAAGFYVDRKELRLTHDLQSLSTEDIMKRLKELDNHDRAIAQLSKEERRSTEVIEGTFEAEESDGVDGELRGLCDGDAPSETSHDMVERIGSSIDREDEEAYN